MSVIDKMYASTKKTWFIYTTVVLNLLTILTLLHLGRVDILVLYTLFGTLLYRITKNMGIVLSSALLLTGAYLITYGYNHRISNYL